MMQLVKMDQRIIQALLQFYNESQMPGTKFLNIEVLSERGRKSAVKLTPTHNIFVFDDKHHIFKIQVLCNCCKMMFLFLFGN